MKEEILWEGKIVLKRITREGETVLRLDDREFSIARFMETAREYGNLGEALITAMLGILDLLRFELLVKYSTLEERGEE